MRGTYDLEARIAEYLKSRCTHAEMPSMATIAGLKIPSAEDGISKRDRAFAALAGKSEPELGEVARKLGAHFADFALEEEGLAVLEQGSPRLTEITRRDVAKVFGDDLSGEQNVVDLVNRLFPLDHRSIASGLYPGRPG